MKSNFRNYASSVVRYASGFKGFSGYKGNTGGGKKPTVTLENRVYTWDESKGDYFWRRMINGRFTERKYSVDLAAYNAKMAKEANQLSNETPNGESKTASPLSVVNTSAEELKKLELPNDVDAAKKTALEALAIVELAVKNQNITEYDLIGAIQSAREQINAAQDAQKTGIGKSNIESVLGQLAGKFQACANIIERNATQDKEEEPKEEPKPEPKEEPKEEDKQAEESSPYANMKTSEILSSVSDDMSVSEKDERLKAWAEKYFVTTDSDPEIVKECEANKEWFSSDKIPPYIRMSRAKEMVRGKAFESIDEGATTYEKWKVAVWNDTEPRPADERIHQYYKKQAYMNNERFRKEYEEWSSRPFDEIVSDDVAFHLGGERLWYTPFAPVVSNRYLSPQFVEAFKIAPRDKLIEVARNLPYHDRIGAEEKSQAKELIDRCLDAASLPTTTDYEAKGIATAIQEAMAVERSYQDPPYSDPYTDEPYEEAKWSLSDFIHSYIPEASLKEIEGRSADSGASKGTEEPQEEPEHEAEHETEPEPKEEASFESMSASEIINMISDKMSEKEQQRAYSAWANKFFDTKSESEIDQGASDRFRAFYTSDMIPAFVKRTALDCALNTHVFKMNGLTFNNVNSIDDLVDENGQRVYLRNWALDRAGEHYLRYYGNQYEYIPAQSLNYTPVVPRPITHYRRYFKLWTLGGTAIDSYGALMREKSPFRIAYDSGRDTLIDFMRGHKFRSGTSKAAKEKSKEIINRYLDVAALPTTTDYEAKGIAYGIRYAIMRAKYEGSAYTNKDDVIPSLIEKYIPESTIKAIASRNPNFVYGQSATPAEAESEPTVTSEPTTTSEPNPTKKTRKPRKPRTKANPTTPTEPVVKPTTAPSTATPPVAEPVVEPTVTPAPEPKAEPTPTTEPIPEAPKVEPTTKKTTTKKATKKGSRKSGTGATTTDAAPLLPDYEQWLPLQGVEKTEPDGEKKTRKSREKKAPQGDGDLLGFADRNAGDHPLLNPGWYEGSQAQADEEAKEQQPTPTTESEPKPEPKPEPKSEPIPEPTPEPEPTPAPQPTPEPVPEPAPEPKTEPKQPEPQPEPVVEEPKTEATPEKEKPQYPETDDPKLEQGVSDGTKTLTFVLNNCFGKDAATLNTEQMRKYVVEPIRNICEYAQLMATRPLDTTSQQQINAAKKINDFVKGNQSIENALSLIVDTMSSKKNAAGRATVASIVKALVKFGSEMVPATGKSYLKAPPPPAPKASEFTLAMEIKKLQNLQKAVVDGKNVSVDQMANRLNSMISKIGSYADKVLEDSKGRINGAEDPEAPTELQINIAKASKKIADKFSKGVEAWKEYLNDPVEDGSSRMKSESLHKMINSMITRAKFLIQRGDDTSLAPFASRFKGINPLKEAEEQNAAEEPKRGRGRPKKAQTLSDDSETKTKGRGKGKGGRPSKDGLTPDDRDFRRRQIEDGAEEWGEDYLSDDEFDALSEEEQHEYNEGLFGGRTLPNEEEKRRREALAIVRGQGNWWDELMTYKFPSKKKEKARSSRSSNSASPVRYRRPKKPYVYYNGRMYVYNDRIGDYVWGFYANGKRVIQRLTEAKIRDAQRLLEARAEMEKGEEDEAASFDAAKAYKGKRIWMGEDAQTIQDGSVVAIKLRRPATDEQRSVLDSLGFVYNEEAHGFERTGGLTDEDCDAMKSCRLMFSDEDRSGRNPNHIDQESYATLRARGIISHIPEKLRGGVPAREKSQKHKKDEGDFGFSWETFERDGRTFFKAGRAPKPELVDQLKKEGFFYDDISRVWSKDGTIEDNDAILKKLGFRWDAYNDEDLFQKYLGIKLPKTDWEALMTNPSALASELSSKYVVSNPQRLLPGQRRYYDETVLDDSPKWDEAVSGAIYDVLYLVDNKAYDTEDPEEIEIPLGDGTFLRFQVFDAMAQGANETGEEAYAFRDADDLSKGMALNLIEEIGAIQRGESYETEDANSASASVSFGSVAGNANDGGWGQYASDHGYGGYYDDSTSELPALQINTFKTNAPNILEAFNNGVFFIDSSTLDKLRAAKPVVNEEATVA